MKRKTLRVMWLKLFWKITNHINKNFCKEKLIINEIRFLSSKELKLLKEKDREPNGIYMIQSKEIGLSSNLSLIGNIENLCHELTHAYQHQIENYHGSGHNKDGQIVYLKFMKETDKILSLILGNEEIKRTKNEIHSLA